jgi:hypothetical protein
LDNDTKNTSNRSTMSGTIDLESGVVMEKKTNTIHEPIMDTFVILFFIFNILSFRKGI